MVNCHVVRFGWPRGIYLSTPTTSDTPRTDEQIICIGTITTANPDGTETIEPMETVSPNFARTLERELAEAKANASKADHWAKECLKAVVDRNSAINQLDLIRDEMQRISARIVESGNSSDPKLQEIMDYCQRSQSNITRRFSVLEELDAAKAILTDHGPNGRNVTNAQHQALREELAAWRRLADGFYTEAKNNVPGAYSPNMETYRELRKKEGFPCTE